MATKRGTRSRCYKSDCVPRHCSVDRRNLRDEVLLELVKLRRKQVESFAPAAMR